MGSATANIKTANTFSNTHWDLWPRLLGSLLPLILFHSVLPTVPQPPRGAAPLSCCLRLLLLCGAIWWHLMLSALLGSQQGVAASQPYGVQPPIHPPSPRPPILLPSFRCCCYCCRCKCEESIRMQWRVSGAFSALHLTSNERSTQQKRPFKKYTTTAGGVPSSFSSSLSSSASPLFFSHAKLVRKKTCWRQL